MPGNKRTVPWEELKRPERKGPTEMEGWVMSEHGVPDSKWTVVKLDHIAHKKQGEYLMTYYYWECECSCENHTHMVLSTRDLVAGWSLSCGCAGKDKTLNGHPNRKRNKYDLTGEYGIGWTTNTNKPFFFDLEDYDKIKDYCWFEHNPVLDYIVLMGTKAGSGVRNKAIRFNQAIGCKGWDHINHDTFDNRKENLRPCTQHQNCFNAKKKKNNTSGIIGVQEQKNCSRKRWKAALMLNRKNVKLGSFENFDDAVKARLRAEWKYFGEFAPQRHLFAQYEIEETPREEGEK